MKILALGAHPDDIELHVGGTIIKLLQQKHEVKGVVVSDMGIEREHESRNSFQKLGLTDYQFLQIDKRVLRADRKCLSIFDKLIRRCAPDLIFTHFHGDSHPDHRAVHQLTIAAARHSAISVLMYQRAVPGGMTPAVFRPQWFEVLTQHQIDMKVASLLEHHSQQTEKWMPHVVGRARYWGYFALADYAEAFEVVKYVR